MHSTFTHQLVTPAKKVSLHELEVMSTRMFEKLVKAVVDIEKGIMIVDAAMHVDEEVILLEDGSEQGNLWGVNLIPDQFGTENFVVFDSYINIRPSWGNRSRSVESLEIQNKIRAVVNTLVTK